MSPETIARLRRLASAGESHVRLSVGTLNALLDAATPTGQLNLGDQLRASAAQALPEVLAQRDRAIEAMRMEQEWIIALRDLLSRKCEAMERGGVSAEDEAELLGFGGASA